MNLQVQKISLSEFDELEKQIFDNDQTFDQMYETWQSLDQFFHNASYETDVEFRLTYFRLYVRLTWKMLAAMDRNYFVDIVRRQILIILISDVDVLNEIMWYLGFNIAERKELESLFLQLKKAFLESGAVVGQWQGKNVTVAQLVKEIDSVYKTGDSLVIADFESRLRQIMFPDEMAKKYFTANPEQAKERFLDLVSFFETFTEENIWYVVDAFLNPEKYQNVPAGEAPPATVLLTPVPTSKPPAPAPKPAVASQPKPASPVAKPPTPPRPAVSAKPTLAQIKSEMEAQFKKDVEGNFEDIGTVLAMLGTLSEKYNEPKIADMLYFDEKENKFRWNI